MVTLYLMCGLPGAGKTTRAKQLEAAHAAVRFSPDEWLHTLLAADADPSERDRLRDHVESLQWDLAQRLLPLGVSVILESGFWSPDERIRFRDQARALGARVELHYLPPPPDELWRRLAARNAALTPNTYLVTRGDLDAWLPFFTPPDDAEQKTYDPHAFPAIIEVT